jgi:hypothetical protein
MYPVSVALTALAMYAGVVSGRLGLTIVISVALLLIGAATCVWGLRVSYRSPRLAGLAIGGWTVAVVLLSGAIFATLTWLGILIVNSAPDKAPTSTKTVAAIAGALVTALVAIVVDRRADILASGLSRRLLCPRLTKLFPAQPTGPQEGVDAYRNVREACFGQAATDWGISARIALFRSVKTAFDQGAYEGGAAWHEPTEPVSPE